MGWIDVGAVLCGDFQELHFREEAQPMASMSNRGLKPEGLSSMSLARQPMPNPSIERTAYGGLRPPTAAAHVKR